MRKSTIILDDLSTSYRRFEISGVSLNLKQGDIFGLIGASGSGKSTLIKAILRLKKLNSGKITFFKDGEEQNLVKNIGYSPQENALFPFLTVRENIYTFGKLYNVSSLTIKARSDILLKRLNLSSSLDKKILELSGGMKKRLDLLISLIHDPNVLILDEPFNGLDISLQKFIWNLIKELSSEGKIIIISSHIIEDIEKNCNKIGLIEEGLFFSDEEIREFMYYHKIVNMEDFLEKVFSDEISIVDK
jgi:ABC-2 type transport system ATP-binding protein